MTPHFYDSRSDSGTAALLGGLRPWSRRLKAAVPALSRLPEILLLTPLIAVTFLSKAAIPPFGAQGIGISLLIILALLPIGLMSGYLRFEPVRFALFLFLMGTLGLSTVLRSDAYSLTSLLLLLAIHVPYMFYVHQQQTTKFDTTDFFLSLCTVIAWLAIAQFVAQFVVGAEYAFPIEHFVPKQFLVQLFNAQGALGYGSDVYRATGVFLYEPSYLSQLMAVAIVAQLCVKPRWFRLVLYLAAMLLSYSGTGMMILAVCLPLVLIARRRWELLFAGIALIAVVLSLGQYLYLDNLLSRANEFSSTGSSGFARFLGGFYLFDQFLWNDPWGTLFGFGAGTFKLFGARASVPVAEMPLFKMVLEFGLVGATLYFVYLFYCLFATPAPKLVALAVAMTFLLNGLYVPFSQGLALTLLVWSCRRSAASVSPAVSKPDDMARTDAGQSFSPMKPEAFLQPRSIDPQAGV
jgi:hypothetical protein